MKTVTDRQMREIEMIAKIGDIAKMIAEISAHTGISVEQLTNENSMIVALAKKELL